MPQILPASRTSVVIIDELPELVHTVQQWLSTTRDLRCTGSALSAREGIELIHKRRPDVILIGLYLPGMDGLQMTKLLTSETPSRVILLAPEDEGFEKTFQKAIHAGARDCLPYPPRIEPLIASIRRVAQIPMDPLPGPKPPVPVAEPHHIIAVCGTKGGVGRSMLATNLAVALADQGSDVVLVDGNLESGDVHLMLNIDAPNGIDRLCQTELDADIIANTAVPYGATRLSMLRAPKQPENAGLVTMDAMKAILVELREHYAITIVDTASHYSEATVAAIETADRLLILTTLELSAINHVKEFLDTLRRLDISADKCWLIGNRIDGVYQIKPAHVERSLGVRFAALLPEDPRTVISAINHGMPFVVNQKRAPLTRNLLELAKRVKSSLAATPVPVRGQPQRQIVGMNR